ncbi:MAG TPA: hypothetical protein VFW37_10395 [Alphaproteobacteria bacterium]|nr:hypothetical protein [Alphaproteobacteria bacterium]
MEKIALLTSVSRPCLPKKIIDEKIAGKISFCFPDVLRFPESGPALASDCLPGSNTNDPGTK